MGASRPGSGNELLDTLVAGIRDEEVAGFVDRQSAWRGKGTGLGRGAWGVGSGNVAPGGEGDSARRQLLDTTVARIGDVDIALRVDGQASRQLELPGVCPFPAPLRQRLAR